MTPQFAGLNRRRALPDDFSCPDSKTPVQWALVFRASSERNYDPEEDL
jgi:hypothetical protein